MNTAVTSESVTKQQASSRRVDWGRISSYLILLVVAVIYLGPLLMLLNTSLKTMPDFMKNATALPATLNFQNFSDAWEKANFPRYLTNTVLYTVSATIIYLITAVFVAFPIARGYVRGAGYLADVVHHRPLLAGCPDPPVSDDVDVRVVQQSFWVCHAVPGESNRHRDPGQLLQDAAQRTG